MSKKVKIRKVTIVFPNGADKTYHQIFPRKRKAKK